MPRHVLLTKLALISTMAAAFLTAQEAVQPKKADQQGPTPGATYPGPTNNGFLLPNGWTISPAGTQVELTDLPLNIQPLNDGRHALVGTAGYNAHKLSLIDLKEKKIVSDFTTRQSWFGLASNSDASKIWWSGGGSGSLLEVDRVGTTLKSAKPEPAPAEKTKGKGKPFASGLAYIESSKKLLQLDINQGTLTETFVDGNSSKRVEKLAERPYDIVVGNGGKFYYISDWSARVVHVVDSETLKVVHRIGVGEHPNQMQLHPKDGRLFVACASANAVYVIDTIRWGVPEIISTALFPRSPEGSTPDALAISPDGETLYVANADNNCVAVIDVEHPSRSFVEGFIPTGWYPTSVAVTPDGKQLLVGVGKGNLSKPNPVSEASAKALQQALNATKSKDIPEEVKHWVSLYKYPYIGTTLSGALSIVDIPDSEGLAEYTSTVYRNCPYSDRMLQTANAPKRKTAIPTKVGDKSPIEHVIYILKENRTYDQVFGDIKRGNGDPSLVLFGEQVTPNHHKLANDYVLLDNLYCNGHVSADGHPWSTQAYNTDYISRNWALTYSGRAGVDDDDEGELSKSPSGFIWDLCARKGLTYRNYGEYGSRVSQPDGSLKMEGRAPGLIGHMSPKFGIGKVPGKRPRDTDNADIFIEEFNEFCDKGTLPNFIMMSLGEDHTDGTRPGSFTPQACVASNDLALGKIVEAVSKSKYWAKTAIFVIEDDAQNGPDHVDAHRTIGLVISPYTRRGHLDSTQYSTVSMMRTMELILGLPPLSQFDAGATPMYESFTDKADLTTYNVVPNKIDLNSKNTALAYGAERSAKMDFSEYDKIDDFELNEILWRAIKGVDAPLPPAVRRAIAFRPADVPRSPASAK
jgi:YVTN family beta-propeller protein